MSRAPTFALVVWLAFCANMIAHTREAEAPPYRDTDNGIGVPMRLETRGGVLVGVDHGAPSEGVVVRWNTYSGDRPERRELVLEGTR